VLRRKSPQRITPSGIDRLVFAGLYALVPSVLDALQIVKPDTVIRWLVPAFGLTGAGNRDPEAVGREPQPKFVSSFA